MRPACLLGALWFAVAGCGTIGPPIPPEEIGVAAKLEREKAKARQLPTPAKEPEKDTDKDTEIDEDRPEDQDQPLNMPR